MAATTKYTASKYGPQAPKLKPKAKAGPPSRPVIVTTVHKGVFFGYAHDTKGDSVFLEGCRMAIRFGTTKGFMELAETGPTDSSKISARADMEVRGVTSVCEVTEKAAEAWEKVA